MFWYMKSAAKGAFTMTHLIHRKRIIVAGIGVILFCCVLFCVLFSSRVMADSGDLTSIHGYERILIRPGDTLDELADTYSSRYSYESMSEYKAKIIRINNLASDYLREGRYLIVPLCR